MALSDDGQKSGDCGVESMVVPDVVWTTTSKGIADEAGIRPDYVLLSAVHDHGAAHRDGDAHERIQWIHSQ
jgi:hypothetical protein